MSSGDLTADRRYEIARALEQRGDLAGAADLLRQAVELAPSFASAWFSLGDLRERTRDRVGAIEAFGKACAADPADRHGAGLRLARLDAGPAVMTADYVRAVFDEYAPRFDQALDKLSYRAPELLRSAVQRVCGETGRTMHFRALLDLGCGTGLSAAAFRSSVDWLVGIDLSPAMIAQARGKGLYDKLVEAELMGFLGSEITANARYGLVIAADVFVYLPDLDNVVAAVERVLDAHGLFAFTVETHTCAGVVLGEKLRYAHAEVYVRDALAGAGLTLRHLAAASTRHEAGEPVLGLIVVAER